MINLFKRHNFVPVLLTERQQDNSFLGFLTNKPQSAELYFGSQYGPRQLKQFEELGITAIVNMRSQRLYYDEAHRHFNYLHLPTVDNNPPSLAMMIEGAAFIDSEIRSGGKVYVNCLKGLGRGPSMVIAYLIQTGMTFDDAHELILGLKPEVKINILQMTRLKELENHYKDALRRELSY